MRRLVALVVLLALCVPLARAEAPALEEAVAEFLLQEDAASRTHLGLKILAAKPPAKAVEAAVREGWWWSEQAPKGRSTSWTRRTDDGASHTIYAYAPEAYTPKRAWPLMVWLHGGVSQREDGGGESTIERFRERAEAEGFLILAPSGRLGSEWWTPRGAKLVRDSLMDVKRRWRVDADRVCAAGLSDGGSGCFHLLAHDPEPYCCFLSFLGNPLTTRLAGGPTWSSALTARPVYAVNGGQDRVFPAEQLRPYFEALADAGCDLVWKAEADLAHDYKVLERCWDEAYAFWRAHPREASPKRVAWTTSRVPAEGRRAWLEITGLAADAAAGVGVPEPLEMEAPDFRRPRLGFRIDQAFEGPGIRVSEVEEDTPAAEAGLVAGDVLVRAGEVELPSLLEIRRLQAYLAGLAGAEGIFLVKRGTEEVEIRAAPKLMEKDRPPRPKALGYGVTPGVVIAEIRAGNEIEIRTRGVRTLRLWLTRDLVDLSKSLTVVVNGEEILAPLPRPDAAVLLSEAIRTGPGAPLYACRVDIQAP